LYGGLGSLTYNLTEGGSAVPYLIGSVGYMVHKYSSDEFPDDEGSEGGLTFGGGAGLGLGKFYVEARYFTASIEDATTAFILVAAGIPFGSRHHGGRGARPCHDIATDRPVGASFRPIRGACRSASSTASRRCGRPGGRGFPAPSSEVPCVVC